MGPLLVIESTSCYRDYLLLSKKHLLLSRLPLLIGNTSCYRKHLLLSEGPLVIESTSSYRKDLLFSKAPLVIETTSSCQKDLLLLKAPLVIESTSCYRKYLLLSEAPLVIESTSCYRKAFLSDREHHTCFDHLTASAPCCLFLDGVIKETTRKVMVDYLQSRVMPWHQYASHVKVCSTSSKMDVPVL